ncbi:MAG: hypothetical protein EYR95_10510, partial [Phormidium sp. SL48-SHIP]
GTGNREQGTGNREQGTGNRQASNRVGLVLVLSGRKIFRPDFRPDIERSIGTCLNAPCGG